VRMPKVVVCGNPTVIRPPAGWEVVPVNLTGIVPLLSLSFHNVVVIQVGPFSEKDVLLAVPSLRKIDKRLFICVVFPPGTLNASSRVAFTFGGANMITDDPESPSKVLRRIGLPQTRGASLICPVCQLGPFNQLELFDHMGLYHATSRTDEQGECPLCHAGSRSIIDHIRRDHIPPEHPADSRANPPTLYSFGLVVVQRSDGKFLLVHERLGEGFWLPGGHVDPVEQPVVGAAREVLEEAGVEVEIMGVLKICYTPNRRNVRFHAIFYAKPKNEAQLPKSIPDFESCAGVWASLDEIRKLDEAHVLRGDEPLVWGEYLAAGGPVYPLSILGIEGAPPVIPPTPTVNPVFHPRQ